MQQAIDIDGLVAKGCAMIAQPARQVLAIAGAPGSGKSTLVETLAHRLNALHPGQVAILPMDGFHYDNAVLKHFGRLAHKGAPDTFDVGGLASVLRRLSAGEAPVAVPVFDRNLEISRGSARIIASDVRLILCEGNYLLLKQDPWQQLIPHFDCTLMIDVPEAILAQRLRGRWRGYDLTPQQIDAKLNCNDLPNGRAVRSLSRKADLILTQ